MLGLTQADFAKRLDISATYVNLIERNQRPVSAAVLLRLAEEFDINVSDLAKDTDATLVNELYTALRDPVFGGVQVSKNETEDLVGASPEVIKAFLRLHERYRELTLNTYSDANPLADREKVELLEESARPVETIRQYIHDQNNYFPRLDEAASAFYAELTKNRKPIDIAIQERLEQKHELKIRILPTSAMPSSFRYFDRHRSGIDISELLHPTGRQFQLAFQLIFIEYRDLIDGLAAESGIQDETAIGLLRVSLANYAAAALLMPYDRFLKACEDTRYDVDLLSHRFGTSFEQTAHRLTTLQKPDARGIPFFFLRIDAAGNVSKRFSAGRFHFSKFGGACPIWNIHRTFEQPGETLTQLIQMPDDTTYVSISKAITRSRGYHGRPPARVAIGLGCDRAYADNLVYFDRMNLSDQEPTLIGVNCYLCDRQNCASRAHAPLNRKLKFDAHARGISLYEFEPPKVKSS
ncbi:short-chain fatty acyl-CoA regulator family protein [Hyphomonas sp. FCG-A18]|uniref:helix-turn-helix domain-containing protein n=1 Tax=Hyphomonas sp. FCG-A18 TaxID=3080019 RepID=UPI002B2DA7D3|nr:short-chain fatty acyl-CoA regulator family protein [Hyphomonas sp. FCG-A18]